MTGETRAVIAKAEALLDRSTNAALYDQMAGVVFAYPLTRAAGIADVLKQAAKDVRDFATLTRDLLAALHASGAQPQAGTLEALALQFHRTIEGEYGCPGLACPGVQRLIIAFTNLKGHGQRPETQL